MEQKGLTIYFREVILPETAGLGVASQVVGGELDVANGEFFAGRMQSGLKEGHSVVLEHVQKGGLACIVETEEKQLGVLVGCVDNRQGKGSAYCA